MEEIAIRLTFWKIKMTEQRLFYDKNLSPEDRAFVKKWHLRVLLIYTMAIVLTLIVNSAVREQPTNVDITSSINTLDR